jgi:hypothetical protein
VAIILTDLGARYKQGKLKRDVRYFDPWSLRSRQQDFFLEPRRKSNEKNEFKIRVCVLLVCMRETKIQTTRTRWEPKRSKQWAYL